MFFDFGISPELPVDRVLAVSYHRVMVHTCRYVCNLIIIFLCTSLQFIRVFKNTDYHIQKLENSRSSLS